MQGWAASLPLEVVDTSSSRLAPKAAVIL